MQMAAEFGEPLKTPRFAESLPIKYREHPNRGLSEGDAAKRGVFRGLAAFLPRSTCLRVSSVFSSVAGC